MANDDKLHRRSVPIDSREHTEKPSRHYQSNFQKLRRIIREKLRALLQHVRPGAALSTLVMLAVVIGCLVAYQHRDALGFGDTATGAIDALPWTYENAASPAFARVGDGLAIATASGIQLLDDKGARTVNLLVPMDNPAVVASKTQALFYDIGGSTCRLVSAASGEITDFEAIAKADSSAGTGSALTGIVRCTVNADGYVCIIGDVPGSKNLVSVYNPAHRLQYQWYSGTGYALRAELGPDNRTLCVLCVDETGTVIHFFHMDSEEELATLRYEEILLYDFYFMSSNRLCGIGSTGLFFFGTDGQPVSVYNFTGHYLSAYDFGSTSFAVVALGDYSAGSHGGLVALNANGEILGSAILDSQIISLSAEGRQILAATATGLSLYNDSLTLQKQSEQLMTAHAALLRSRGDVLLLSTYAAELLTF